MNLKNLLPLICLMAAFLSCDQSDEDEFTFPIPRIKTMVVYNADGTPQTFQFTYDAQGRIVQRTIVPHGKETYRYLADSLIVTQTHWNNILFRIDSLWLNDQGLAITHKIWEKGQSPNGNAYTSTYTNEYNPEGYLIQSSRTNAAYEIQDGNTVKQIHYYRSDDPWQDSLKEVNYTVIYQYMPNSVNTIGFENMGMAFLGKQNKNLVSEIGSPSSDHPDQTIKTNWYSYRWDDRNRVIVEFDEASSNWPAKRFTYYE